MKKISAFFYIFMLLLYLSAQHKLLILAKTSTPTPTTANTNNNSSSNNSSSTSTWTTCILINGKIANGCKSGNGGGGPVLTGSNIVQEAAQALYNSINAIYPRQIISRAEVQSPGVVNKLKATPFSGNIFKAFNSFNMGGFDPFQCTSFVYTSVALATGSNISFGVGSAADMLGYDSFQSGSYTFHKLPKGSVPQSGDVGVASPFSGNGVGGAGHILIVKQPQGRSGFIALEGNTVISEGSGEGYVGDSNLWPDTQFYFYRGEKK